MRSALIIALLLGLVACSAANHRPPPCAGFGPGPCGPERPANGMWKA